MFAKWKHDNNRYKKKIFSTWKNCDRINYPLQAIKGIIHYHYFFFFLDENSSTAKTQENKKRIRKANEKMVGWEGEANSRAIVLISELCNNGRPLNHHHPHSIFFSSLAWINGCFIKQCYSLVHIAFFRGELHIHTDTLLF